MPKPRHDIARYLEDITKPMLIKEIPNPVDRCVEAKSRIGSRLKFSTNDVFNLDLIEI